MDGKITFTAEQAMKAQRGYRYSSTPSLTSALGGVGSEGRAPAEFTQGNRAGSYRNEWMDTNKK